MRREGGRPGRGGRTVRAGRGALARLAALLLVAGLVVATHWPVLHAQALALDDREFVLDNPLVTQPGWGSVARFFGEVAAPSSVRGYYLPLSMTSLMLDWAMGGRAGDLTVFHRTSLALHVAATLLVLLLLERLLGALLPAAIAAALYGLHPLAVEPMAWIGERKTLLAAVFAFASILAYVEFVKRRRPAWLFGSAAGFALALLAKPTVVSLPLLLVVLDAWPLRRLSRAAVLEKWPFALLAILSAAVSVLSLTRTETVVAVAGAGPGRAGLQIGHLLGFYLGKIVWPVPLLPLYPPPEPWTLSNPAVLGGVLASVLLTVALFVLRRAARAPLAGWIFFVLALAPTFGVLRWSWVIASDKYLYFPALGLLLALAAGLARAGRPASASLLALALVAGAAEAAATRATLRSWRDSLTLWRHVARYAPQAPGARNGLGVALEAAGDLDEAEREYARAVVLGPGFAQARLNLGRALIRLGRTENARRELEVAGRLEPRDPGVHYFLGLAAQQSGRLDEAIARYRRALELRPDFTEAFDRLGSVLVLSGRVEEGLGMLRASVARSPGSAHAHFALAMALLYAGGPGAEAIEHLRAALKVEPGWAEPLTRLAWLEATSSESGARDPADALRLADRAVEVTGRRDAAALDARAAALAAAGRFEAAVAAAGEALARARATGDDSLARAIEARLVLYRRRVAYTEASGPAR